MGSGTIPIEAAFYASSFPVNFYNKEKFAFLKLDLGIDYKKFFEKIDKKINLEKKLHITGYDKEWVYVNNAKKNAKIAGIHKLLNISRVEGEWLDYKFEKGKIDRIVTQPPCLTNNTNPKAIQKVYEEFFYQVEYILNEKGTIALVARRTEELKQVAAKYKFTLKEERQAFSGKEILKLLIFHK